METTRGFLLGRRIPYVQPAAGYRTGIEPVLLAASIPALPGNRVLEAGLGAGAGLLCLLARVPGAAAAGVELDPALAALASQNLCGTGGAVITGDILSVAGLALFDHAYANPPWHDPSGTPSPHPGRRAAKQAGAATLANWIARLAGCVRAGGSVTVLVPAPQAGSALEALRASGCGGRILFPLWPKAGRDAKLVLVRGLHGRRTPGRIAPGLVLHVGGGAYTAEADAILSGGAPLVL